MSEASPFAVRRLQAGDFSALRALNMLFADAFGDRATYRDQPPDGACLGRLLSRPHVFILVAEQDGALVGGLTAYALDKPEQARAECYIYDLAVAAPHRRSGIATALIGALRLLAQAYGAWVIFVQADYGDDPALALYTKLGKREDVVHFDIPILSGNGHLPDPPESHAGQGH